MSSVRMTSAFVSSFEENCLSKRKTTQVTRSASEKAELGERFEEQGGKVVLYTSSECCEHESDLRTTAGIVQVSDG
jgi:hypothetical protein